jgi:hypothetical protein
MPIGRGRLMGSYLSVGIVIRSTGRRHYRICPALFDQFANPTVTGR